MLVAALHTANFCETSLQPPAVKKRLHRPHDHRAQRSRTGLKALFVFPHIIVKVSFKYLVSRALPWWVPCPPNSFSGRYHRAKKQGRKSSLDTIFKPSAILISSNYNNFGWSVPVPMGVQIWVNCGKLTLGGIMPIIWRWSACHRNKIIFPSV